VTILPGAVFGPPLSSRKSGESVGMLQARAIAAQGRMCSRAVSQVVTAASLRTAVSLKKDVAHLPQKFIEGKNWPAVPPMGFGCVDVDDIASAHALAAFTPSASGRCAAQTALRSPNAATALLRSLRSPCAPRSYACRAADRRHRLYHPAGTSRRQSRFGCWTLATS